MRSYYELQKNGTRGHHVVIVRYEWKGPKTKLVIKPHGRMKNPDKEEPFVRSKKSLIAGLKMARESSKYGFLAAEY